MAREISPPVEENILEDLEEGEEGTDLLEVTGDGRDMPEGEDTSNDAGELT